MKTIISLVFFLMLVGCASTGSTSSSSAVRLPFWYYNPNLDSFYGVAVKAKVQKFGGLEAQMRAAMTQARVEIARTARVHVRSSQTSTSRVTRDSVDRSSEDLTSMSAGEALRLDEVFLKEQWVHPETGELYIWVLMPK